MSVSFCRVDGARIFILYCSCSCIVRINWTRWYGVKVFYAWMETQRQTIGDAIAVGGMKPMLDDSIDTDRIA